MCSTCKKALHLSKSDLKAALALVAKEMETGDGADCLDATIGKLMGEELPEYDVERDGEWEVGHR